MKKNKVNNPEDEILDIYLKEISKEPSISDKEELILAVQIKEGNKISLDRLVKGNLRFVVSVAKQYQNQGLLMLDLINEGNLGLIKAAEKFDETKGFKFISYASYWIRQSIISALIEQSRIVRLPLNQIGSLNKINKASNKLEQDLCRVPSIQELAEETEIPAYKVEDSLSILAVKQTSLDAPLSSSSEEDKTTWIDVIEDPNSKEADKSLILKSLSKDIDRCLSTLTEKEREILKLFFGIGVNYNYTLEEIGERFNLTRERVRQIKEKAVRRLRHSSRNKLLLPYL